MAYITSIYFRNITNLSDARYGAAAGFDLMGYNMDSSDPNVLTPDKVREINGWVSGPLCVGQFGTQPAVTIEDAIEVANLEGAEVPASEMGRLSKDADQFNVIGRMLLSDIVSGTAASSGRFLLIINDLFETYEALMQDADAANGLADLIDKNRVYVQFNFNADDTRVAVNHFNPEGIAIEGGSEEKVGIRDFSDVDDIRMALED